MTALTIGLTGGVASGKTVAADAFHALGVPVLDADTVARDVVRVGSPAYEEIKRTFGAAYFGADGELDRRRLRERVFANPVELKRLEAITHPAIRAQLTLWRDTQTAPYCILSVAILIESGMDALVDRVLVVDAPREAQLQRLRMRDGITEALARQMLAAQASREARLARADDVIRNDGTHAQLQEAVKALHARYLAMAAGSPEAESSSS